MVRRFSRDFGRHRRFANLSLEVFPSSKLMVLQLGFKAIDPNAGFHFLGVVAATQSRSRRALHADQTISQAALVVRRVRGICKRQKCESDKYSRHAFHNYIFILLGRALNPR